MAVYNNSVQTVGGSMLENQIRGGEGYMEFTYIEVGSGIYTEDDRKRIRYVNSLKEVRQRFPFNSISTVSDGDGDYLSLESVIHNKGLTEGYHLTEIGIFARLSGEEEAVLYCICVVDEPDYMPPQIDDKVYEIILESLVKCYDAEHVTIRYEDNTYATAKALMEHILNTDNPHKVTAEQLGLENVDNTADMNKPVSTAQQAAIDAAKKEAGDGLDSHIQNTDNPHKVTAEQLGLENVDNTADMNKPVSTAQQDAIDAAYQQATAYASQIVNALINGAPGDLDTIGELAQAMENNKDVVAILRAAIGSKADQAELDGHTGNNTIHITSTERTNWNDANSKKHSHSNKSILDAITGTIVDGWNSAVTHISDAIKHITAAERKKWNNGSANYGTCSTAAATAAKTVACDGFELDTGAEITVKFTVTNTAANPTLNVNSTGAKSIYYRGSAVAAGYLAANRTYIFRYNGTQYELVGDINTNTTYSNMTAATASTAGKAGLVPAPAAGAQGKYLTGAATFENIDDHAAVFTSGDETNPTGWADIGAVTSGEKHSSLWRKFSLTVKNLRYIWKLIGNTQLSVGDGTITGAINQLNTDIAGKQATITGAATTITGNNLTASRIMVTNADGKVSVSSVGSADLGNIAGGTGNFQTQIGGLDTKIKTLSDLISEIPLNVFDKGPVSTTEIFRSLTAPTICLTSTERISNKPTGKYGVIVIFKYSDTRAGAICICTDGTVYHNVYNPNDDAAIGWK